MCCNKKNNLFLEEKTIRDVDLRKHKTYLHANVTASFIQKKACKMRRCKWSDEKLLIRSMYIITHREEEVHDAGVQQRFPPRLRRLQHDVLRGLEHGDVVAPQWSTAS